MWEKSQCFYLPIANSDSNASHRTYSPSMSLLAPSPEITPRGAKISPPPARSLNFTNALDIDDCVFQATHLGPSNIPPVAIPQDPVPRLDRQSIHYPGFDIHQDAQTVLPHAKSSSAEDLMPLDAASETKENIPPSHARSRKASLTASPDNAKRFSLKGRLGEHEHEELAPPFALALTGSKPRFGVTDCDPDVVRTPRRKSRAREMASPFALSLSPFNLHSPGKTPATTRLQRCEARRLLLDEVNEVATEDDEDF